MRHPRWKRRVGILAILPFCAGIGAFGAEKRPGTVIANSIGMKLAWIPEGKFMMGSDDRDPNAKDKEKPRHRVRISKPFYLGVHEVTIGQFREFVRAKKFETDAERSGYGGWGWHDAEGEFRLDPEYTWRDTGFAQEDDQPVVNVSWNDANVYCRWLSRKEGAQYRLPTEAEWEYAARAGTTTIYLHGDDVERLPQYANVMDAAAREHWKKLQSSKYLTASDGFAFSAPVGEFPANRWGLFDMIGNAREWCSDRYGSKYYGDSPTLDPRGRSEARYRVIRGGGFSHSASRYCRVAARERQSPTYRSLNLGFRVVRGIGSEKGGGNE